MIAVEVLEDAHIEKLKGFGKRIKWFLKYRPDLARLITRCTRSDEQMSSLLALLNRDRLGCLLSRLLDETEFLSRTASARSLRLIGQTRVAWKLADNRIPWNMPRETPLLDVWRKFQLARPDLVSN